MFLPLVAALLVQRLLTVRSTRKHQVRLRGGGICMSKTASVRVAPLDTRPPDVAQAAAAEEEAARASAAAAAAFAGAETERLRMQVEADKTAQAKAAAEAETERLRMQVEAAEEEARAKTAAAAGRGAIATNAVAAEHARLSKTCLDPSSLVLGKYGDIALFDRRLAQDVGVMDSKPLRGIMSDHCMWDDSLEPFNPANNTNLTCTPKGQWIYVVGQDGFNNKTFEIDLTARPTYDEGDLVEGRNAKSLGELMRAPEVERAGLSIAEVVALRLFTGPMHYRYNQVLRDSLSMDRRGRASGLKWKAVGATRPADGEDLSLPGLAAALASKTEFLPDEWASFGVRDLRMNHYVEAGSCYFQPAGRDLTVNLYSTTLHVIVSGICKLSGIARMPAGSAEMEVFRGLAGVVLPPEFFEEDAQGFAGAVEASFMSATKDEGVARRYSAARQGRAATIFKLVLGKKSLGADVSWLSQFEGEGEVLFGPRTHLQVVGKPVLGSDGVSTITLRPTTYQNVATTEEVMASRKEGLKHLSSELVWDLRNEAVRDGKLDGEVAQRLDAAGCGWMRSKASLWLGFRRRSTGTTTTRSTRAPSKACSRRPGPHKRACTTRQASFARAWRRAVRRRSGLGRRMRKGIRQLTHRPAPPQRL